MDSNADAKRLFLKLKREADASLDDSGNPVAQIETAGKLQSDPAKARSLASLVDMKKLYALGYAYAVTSNNAYSSAARRIILHWAEVNQPTGVPIDETKLEPLFIAYDLTRNAFSDSDQAKVGKWLHCIADMEQQTARAKSVTAMNNWNSHRLMIVGLIGFLLRDQRLIDYAVSGFRWQIEVNLLPDGSSFDFHERDALHYHCYDLEPLLTLAIAASQNGFDLFHYQAPSGASLPRSVAFLVPYCTGKKTHIEWVHSKVAFDRQRAGAGEKKFAPGSTFDPREGRKVFELASYFNQEYRQLVSTLTHGKPTMYPTWQTVLDDACQCKLG
ncbi:MAG: alginate lyase family protein [Candidatus Omnitrophica bacterium]|nr:alginate lyase family protein [Candidatus Omnitrophota bacterium]